MSRSPVTHQLVTLEAITKEQAPVLSNLFELYVHDFSEHVPCQLKANGRFDLSIDERWWTDAEHFPFLVRHGSELCGFVLARRGSRVSADVDAMDVAEFFIVRGARRKGAGMAAAHALFTRFPGRWEMRVRRTNGAAMSFWVRVAAAWLGAEAVPTPFSAQGVTWGVVRVDSLTAPAR